MKLKIQASILILIFLLLGSFNIAEAQSLPPSPGAVSGLKSLTGIIPTVPTSNPALEAKETGINIFGKTIPISWDGIAIQVAKHVIERMVDSTVDWINNGFDGNPAYVTDPQQYFADIADGVAGEFIGGEDSKLKFLCSPFKAQVKIALHKSYTQTAPYQCRLTGVIANIDNFYNDFSQGGWEGWFAMTQDNANNPYGSYIEAKIDLDSQIASALKIKENQLAWSGGFLSREKCDAMTVPASISKSGVEECVDATGKPVAKKIITPGRTIASGLEEVLGTNVRQLELADEFDELIGALMGQLLQKTIFSAEGLFNTKHKVASASTNNNSPIDNSEPQCNAPLPLPSGSAPDMRGVVSEVAAEFPQLLMASAANFDFLDKVVERLHAGDPNWGYNGKRGDSNNLSQDAVAYMSDPGNPTSVHIIDIIGGHGGPNPTPAWQDVTADTYNCGTVGVYVYPRGQNSAPGPEPEPQV